MRAGIGPWGLFRRQVACRTLLAALGVATLTATSGGDEPSAPRPGLLTQALQRMRTEAKPGVILLIPDEPRAAERLANNLSYLLGAPEAARKLAAQEGDAWATLIPPHAGTGDEQARRLFSQAVFVCLKPDAARRVCPDLKADTAAVLLDSTGKLVDQLSVSSFLLSDEFVERIGPFLHGARGEHLAAAVAAQRTALGRDFCARFDRAIRELSADEYEVREAASKTLSELAPRVSLLLNAAFAGSSCLEAKRRLKQILTDLCENAPFDKPGPRLPLGARWQEVDYTFMVPRVGRGLRRGPQMTAQRMFLRFTDE